MSLKPCLSALALIAASTPSFAAPEFRLEAGYTQFQITQEINERQSRGSSVADVHEHHYNSGSGLRLAAEAAWSLSENLEWVTAASLSYGLQPEWELEATDVATNSSLSATTDLDEMSLLTLSGGLRWHHRLSQDLRLHVGAAASVNQWRYRYTDDVIDIISGSGTITQFVIRRHTFKNDDHYLAVEAAAGMYYALSPHLEATLGATGQIGNDYNNLQLNAGLRYRFK